MGGTGQSSNKYVCIVIYELISLKNNLFHPKLVKRPFLIFINRTFRSELHKEPSVKSGFTEVKTSVFSSAREQTFEYLNSGEFGKEKRFGPLHVGIVKGILLQSRDRVAYFQQTVDG